MWDAVCSMKTARPQPGSLPQELTPNRTASPVQLPSWVHPGNPKPVYEEAPLPVGERRYGVVVSYRASVFEGVIGRVASPYEVLYWVGAPNADVARERVLKVFERDQGNSSVRWSREIVSVEVRDREDC